MTDVPPGPYPASPHARSPLEAGGWTFVLSQIMKVMLFLDRHGKRGWASAARRELAGLLVPAEQGLRRLIMLMARRLAPRPVAAASRVPPPPTAASPATLPEQPRPPAFRLTEPAPKPRPTGAPAPAPTGTSPRPAPDGDAANGRLFRRILALVVAQRDPERLARRLARRLQSKPGSIPLAAPRLRDMTGASAQEKRLVYDLDARARAVPDTS